MKKAWQVNLIARRKYLGLTQDQAAEKLNEKKGTYAAWEENRGEPSVEKWIKICDVFHIQDLYQFFKNAIS